MNFGRAVLNPIKESRNRSISEAPSEDRVSSFFSDSQTSWVVFRPDEQQTNDILSLSTENSLTDAEDSDNYSSLLEDENQIKVPAHDTTAFSQGQRPHLPKSSHSSQQELDDDLIDDLEVSLSNRINEWQKTTDTAVSDNIASWDLDADLIGHVLDTSILQRVPAYYGDSYFKHMSKQEYLRFKRSSTILKQSLTRKGFNTSDPDVIARLLSLLKWRELLNTSGSLIDDYIVNTLSRVHFREQSFRDAEFSDTATSSSLVMCGGASWNDL